MSGSEVEARFEREEVEKEDGRYIVFYTFGEGDGQRTSADTDVESNRENRNGTGPGR